MKTFSRHVLVTTGTFRPMRFAPGFEPDDVPAPSDDLDEDFPLGDGTADQESSNICPYCCEAVTLALDAGSGASQEYVEDCPVCCQPWQVTVNYNCDGHATVRLEVLS